MASVNQQTCISSDTGYEYNYNNVLDSEYSHIIGNKIHQSLRVINTKLHQSSPHHAVNTHLSLQPYNSTPITDNATGNYYPAAGLGRRPIPIRRIPNLRQRQVTFCKRKSSLLRKAKELSSISNSDVGLIIFSPSGNMFHYATSSLDTLLERYKIYLENQNDTCNNACATSPGHSCARDLINILKNIERITLQEDFNQLNVKQLQQLEEQLECSIYRVKEWKMELL